MKIGLTYDDVLVIPRKTPLKSRNDARIGTKVTRNTDLNIPLISSNMASVTEHQLAIALAREGGMGVLHQFLPLEEQVEEVKKVKRSTSYIIEHPLFLSQNTTIEQATKTMQQKKVTSVLVGEKHNVLGIVTRRDYLFEKKETLLADIMTPRAKLITATKDITIQKAEHLLHTNRIEKLPIIDNNVLKGLITTKDLKRVHDWQHACRDNKGRLKCAAAVGVKDTLERSKALIDAGADVIVLDIAHGHADYIIEQVKEFKKYFSTDILVGNIATAQAAKDLIDAGADGLKVGIGPSPVCTTRIMTGAGVPQVTAIMDVAEVAKQYNIPVCADGGTKTPGDMVKAIVAGADNIMSGSLFAGTDESPGMIVLHEGKRYKRYYGSASYHSNHERYEKFNKTKAQQKLDVHVEGIATLVDYKGPLKDIISQLVKGIKSGVSYCGCSRLQDIYGKAELMRITQSGYVEGKGRGKMIGE